MNIKVRDDPEDVADAVQAVQEGDQEALLHALKGRIISAVATDIDGCSLLHWAALNNRLAIARLLLSYGGDPTQSGGVLDEVPLQWAIRKNYMAMAKLLIHWTNGQGQEKRILQHKSKLGNDALHLAIRQFDAKQVFLLLHWGANPNSLDSEGNTPLLWMVKNLKGHHNNKGIIRLLLKYGCDSSLMDNDLCNPMHILAKDTDFEIDIAFLIYQNMNDIAKYAKNGESLTPRVLAIHRSNPRFVQFIIDAYLFSIFPYHSTTSLGFITIVSLPSLVHLNGMYLGLFYSFLVWFFLAQFGFQWSINCHQDRVTKGMAFGLVLSIIFSFKWYISPFTDSFSVFIFICSFGLSVCLAAKFAISKPYIAKPGDPNEIAEKIVSASIQLGPDEMDNDDNDGKESGRFEFTILKNKENNQVLKSRKVRLCTSCLTDKTSTTSHCKYCDACVMDCDRHFPFIGNCVGRGNTFLFTIMLLSCAWTFFLYVYISTRSLRIALCPDSKGILWNVFAVQTCISENFPGATIMIMLVTFALLNCLALVQIQFVLVTRYNNINIAKVKLILL